MKGFGTHGDAAEFDAVLEEGGLTQLLQLLEAVMGQLESFQMLALLGQRIKHIHNNNNIIIIFIHYNNENVARAYAI
jgi:hypothetical protein